MGLRYFQDKVLNTISKSRKHITKLLRWASAQMQAWEITATKITPNLRIMLVREHSLKEENILMAFKRVGLEMLLVWRRILFREFCDGIRTEGCSKNVMCLQKWRVKQYTSRLLCMMKEMKWRCLFEILLWWINEIINL